MIKAGIIGAAGYAGIELLRILYAHPEVKVAAVASVSTPGQAISEIYPALYGIYDGVLVSPEQAIEESDVVFASVPHGVSEAYAAIAIAKNKVFIDLGADFRLENEDDYEKWYGKTYENHDLHKMAVYGLPELNREALKTAKIIANPGCYPTSIALALAPAFKNGLVSPYGLIIDAKSGVTGAGRSLSQATHFADLNEGFAPYKLAGSHRHTPEIEQTLSHMAGAPVTVTFTPHLLPVSRGILATIYAKLCIEDIGAIDEIYHEFYASEPFVKVLKKGTVANIKNVRMSNLCHISLHADERTGMLVIVSAIDNMVKGAAGQAVQNMNLAFRLPETCGLMLMPPAI